MKLLADLFTPTSGQILINNEDLREIKHEYYWAKISPVFQDFSRFKFSVGDSISFEEKTGVGEALQFSGLPDLNSELQLGKEFGGTDLSGGQWQKLAIARAFYKNNVELYLFDEANSALDVHSEKKLYQKLMELSAGATVIWITHRMTSVKLSDKVIYLDKGKVLGFDSHENLLKNENYASLYREQFE